MLIYFTHNITNFYFQYTYINSESYNVFIILDFFSINIISLPSHHPNKQAHNAFSVIYHNQLPTISLNLLYYLDVLICILILLLLLYSLVFFSSILFTEIMI